MNKLSWFLYWTGVVDPIITFAGFMVFVGLLLVGGAFIWFAIVSFNTSDKDIVASVPYLKKYRVFVVFFVLFFYPVYFLTPNRQTLILIAGSEVGERVVKSEQVQGVVNPGLDMLKLWIKTETDRLMKKSEGK